MLAFIDKREKYTMALNAKKIKNTNFGPKQAAMDEGTYPCRVVQVIDMGL